MAKLVVPILQNLEEFFGKSAARLHQFSLCSAPVGASLLADAAGGCSPCELFEFVIPPPGSTLLSSSPSRPLSRSSPGSSPGLRLGALSAPSPGGHCSRPSLSVIGVARRVSSPACGGGVREAGGGGSRLSSPPLSRSTPGTSPGCGRAFALASPVGSGRPRRPIHPQISSPAQAGAQSLNAQTPVIPGSQLPLGKRALSSSAVAAAARRPPSIFSRLCFRGATPGSNRRVQTRFAGVLAPSLLPFSGERARLPRSWMAAA